MIKHKSHPRAATQHLFLSSALEREAVLTQGQDNSLLYPTISNPVPQDRLTCQKTKPKNPNTPPNPQSNNCSHLSAMAWSLTQEARVSETLLSPSEKCPNPVFMASLISAKAR